MPTDFERELADLLHTITPEPPDHMTPPTVVALAEATPAAADADMIDVAIGSRRTPSAQRRWPVLLAAAAVAGLAAGVVALVAHNGHTSAPRPGASGTVTSLPTATAPQCDNDQLVVESPPPFAARGHTASIQPSYLNRSATRCALLLPSVTISTGSPTRGVPFPSTGGTVQIPAHGRLVISADVRISGTCRKANSGLYINLIDGGWTYSAPLGIAGCTLTPVQVTQHVVG